MTKRRKFILSSIILTLGLSYVQFGEVPNRYQAIGILSLLTIPLTLWSLKEALGGAVWLVSWILISGFTVGVGLFYFLLPGSLLAAVPIIILYFLGTYALFLSENIFSVAAIRTIQLFRSAWAVSFLLTLLTSFLLFDTILSFRLPFYQNFLLVVPVSFLLFLHGFWSINLEEKISRKVLLYSFVWSLGIGQTALVLSFWPATLALFSLFLTVLVYVALGLTQAKFSERMFKKTVREYLYVGGAVFLVLLLYTVWG